MVLGNSVSGRDDGNIGRPAGMGFVEYSDIFLGGQGGPSALTFRIYAPLYIPIPLFLLERLWSTLSTTAWKTLSSTGRNREEVSSAYIELENIFDLTIQFQIFLCGREIISYQVENHDSTAKQLLMVCQYDDIWQ